MRAGGARGAARTEERATKERAAREGGASSARPGCEPEGTGTPTPGRPVRGSATGRPIMAALDLLGRRWVLRILWELRDGPLGFRALQKACDGMSSSVLASRLADLTGTGIVIIDDSGDYALSETGRRLRTAMRPLLDWSHEWAASLEDRVES
jgi:DNA-binding HxlR family transcriptional regulator